jgi:PAS domain S-box-containing protein
MTGNVLPFIARPMARREATLEESATIPRTLNVVVIDDAPEDRMKVRTELSADGFRLNEIQNGSDEPASVRASKPDCVIIGAKTFAAGREILDRLKNAEGRPSCAVVMLVATSGAQDGIAALRARATDYLIKGHHTPDSFRQVVRNAVDRFEVIESRRLAQQQNAHLAAIVASSNDAIISLDRTGIVQSWNPGATLLFGYEASEAVGRSARELILPGDRRSERDKIYETVRSGEQAIIAKTLRRHKKGDLIPVCLCVSPIVGDAGDVAGVSLICRDITEEMRREKALENSERTLRLALEASGAGVWQWDIAEGKAVVSDSYRALYGLTADEPVTLESWMEMIHPEDRDMCRRAADDHFINGKEYVSEFRFMHPRFGERWISGHGRVERDADGHPTFFRGINVDITQRKRAQLQEAMFARLAEHSHDFFGLADLDGTLTYLNGAGRRMIGVDDRHDVGTLHFSDYIAPNSLPVHENVAMPALLSNGSWEGEMQFIKLDTHEVVDVYRSNFALRDLDGKPIAIAKVTHDITARKRNERKLAESEARYRLALESAKLGVFQHNVETDVVFWDDRTRYLFGARAEENFFSVSRMIELVHPDDRAAVIAEVKKSQDPDGDGQYLIDHRVNTLDGTTRWVSILGKLRFDGEGANRRAVYGEGTVRDITERKLAEERQQVLLREIAHRGQNLFAVIRSIAQRSLSGKRTLEAGKEVFLGRLHALSKSYAALAGDSFESAPLVEVVENALSAFGGRARISGENILLSAKAAQTMGLAVHELATNAAKYGALSVPGGRLSVAWTIQDDAGAPNFCFHWVESDGPAAKKPTRMGFGTTLVERVVGSEFGCKPRLEYLQSGFEYPFESPLAAIGVFAPISAVRHRLRSNILRGFYDAWSRRRGAVLPSFMNFDFQNFKTNGGLTLAEIDAYGAARLIEIGIALTERLADASDILDMSKETPKSIAEAYALCAKDGAPCHEHAHFDFGDDAPVTYERLLLPFADTAGNVSHVAGIVVFSGATNDDKLEPSLETNFF